MARIRTIKPEFATSINLYRCEVEVNKNNSGPYLNIRAAYAMLFTAADRLGRFVWDSDRLKLSCCPYDPIDFTLVLEALATWKDPFIQKYEVNGRQYGVIINFLVHQRPKVDEAQSVLPSPPASIELQPELKWSPNGVQLTQEGKGRELELEGMEGRTDAPGPTAPPQVVLQFPVTGGKQKTWDLDAVYLKSLQESFPALNIMAEARKAKGWLESHPSRLKTPKGMRRFLFSWMDRAQNGFGIRNGSAPGPTRHVGTAAAGQRTYPESR